MKVTERYEEVKYYASKHGPCVGCGKEARRDRVFSQTINPFNKNARGVQKTRAEIHAELVIEANKWRTSQPVYHAKCEPVK